MVVSMKKEGLLAILVLGCVLAAVIVYGIFTGTTEGYARFMDNTVVVGANITITVSGCSGDGCVRNTTTDSNGYYVVANLNLPASGGVSGFGQWNGGNGTNTSTADSFQAASLNITICRPPSTPTIAEQTNTHATSTNFNWTSGTDPLSLTTYDNITYESNESTQTSPYTKTGINASSNTTRSWNVRTCNSLCCSPRANDTFVAVNDAPAAPSLTAVPDTHDQNATFYWTNFSDPDGDGTYNDFRIDNGTITTNATSPQNRSSLSFASHTWEVRTCDTRGGCSAFSSDTFTVGNNAPSRPNLTAHGASASTTISFEWVSGADSDGDATRDEISVSNDSMYSYLLFNSSNQTSPLTITNATFYQSIFWRVRTCDALDSCSGYANDTFVTYQCTSSGGGSSGGGGGGGGSCVCQNECEAGVEYCSGNARVVCGNFDGDTCTDKKVIACEGTDRCVDGLCVAACDPHWLCTDWSSCTSSTSDQSRVCSDINACGVTTGRPPQERSCAFSGLSPEQQKTLEEQQPFKVLGVTLPGTFNIPIKKVVQPLSTPVGAAAALALGSMGFAAIMFRRELMDVMKKAMDFFDKFSK